MRNQFIIVAMSALLLMAVSAHAELQILRFEPARPICRALRPYGLLAAIENSGEAPAHIEVSLALPKGIRLTEEKATRSLLIEDCARQTASWKFVADAPGVYELSITTRVDGTEGPAQSLSLSVLPAMDFAKHDYIPEPAPAPTEILVGAHNCPLWEADRPAMWAQVVKHPERTPALGYYSQENPEVADWETKWAVEHGIGFFIYCWYRASQGEPVKMNFSSAIHDAFFQSKFVDKMKFTIMWENQSRGRAGVSDRNDLMENLLPFWIDTYFKHPSYLKIDNKPLLFVYRPEFLIDDLGGVEQVKEAFGLMREACKRAGFDGLYLLGEYRGLDAEHLELMKSLGLDYTFAYVWYVPDNPTPEQSIHKQIEYITKTREMGILPQVVTVSQAWSGWHDEGTIWKIPPADFATLLRRAKEIISSFPAHELGSKLMLLDNWNEWSEGHYIAPYREYGFGYLDAVRDVFVTTDSPHTDLLPEDIGMGPYDTAYKSHTAREEALRVQLSEKASKGGAPQDGLIGWWAFDEAADSAIALDYSGHRMGGRIVDAQREPGIDGNALVCNGGSVAIPNHPRLSPATALTIECWVKSARDGQSNAWCVSRVFGGGTSTGYRLGILDGKPCFEVPQTDWSHHLTARDPLPTGQWVHLAGTFDGHEMRIYVNGEEQGRLARPGSPNANTFHLVLGNYEAGHQSYFRGLLDEVKLYDHALTAEEVLAQARRFASSPAESR